MTKAYPALSLSPKLAAQFLSYLETARPGTEVFFHITIGLWPRWLDKDVRRLRLHVLPNYTFGKVAMFNRVPFDSISLRDCTAKGEGFIIMWQPSTGVSSATRVSSVPLSQLWVEYFYLGQ